MDVKKVKRLWPVIFGLVLLGAVVGYRITDNISENKARAQRLAANGSIVVQMAVVGRDDLYPAVMFSAGLEPVWSTELSAKMDGRIEALYVSEGEQVNAGKVAAQLDGGDLAGQVMQAEGNLMAAKSTLEQAEMDYNRYAALADEGAISMQVLDNARTKRDAAIGQVKAAEGALDLVKEKEKNLDIVVPRDAVITKRHLQAGAFARSATPIVTVADTTTLLAKATIGESQISGVALGAQVKVWVEALSETPFRGIVTRISPVAELPARTFTADIAIDNSEGILKAGMFAKVEIPTAIRKDVLVIPESAIVYREDQPSVYVVLKDQTAQQQLIQTGATGDGWVEVMAGLSEGDKIVVGGQHKVRDGSLVTSSAGGGTP